MGALLLSVTQGQSGSHVSMNSAAWGENVESRALALNDSTQHTCRFCRCYIGHSQSHVPQKKRCGISVNRPEERIPKEIAWGFQPIVLLLRAKKVTHALVQLGHLS